MKRGGLGWGWGGLEAELDDVNAVKKLPNLLEFWIESSWADG